MGLFPVNSTGAGGPGPGAWSHLAAGGTGRDRRAGPRRVGLVGCGRFARFVLTAAARLPDFRLAAVASRSRENRDSAAALWRRLRPLDAPPLAIPRWEELLAVPLDAVLITAPPHLHEEMGLAFLAAGRPVLLEKPGALRPEGLLALQREADRRRVAAAVNMVLRQNPLYRLLRRSLATGWLADLHLLEVANEAHGDLPPRHWFWNPALGGGILVEHGIHFLDLFAWLAGSGRPLAAWQTPSSAGRVSPRVLALVEHPTPAPALAVHGHAFVHTPGRGRCRVRFVWRDCFLTLSGWTAHRARLEGSVPPAVAGLWRAAGAREEARPAAAGGKPAAGETRLVLDLGREEDVYRESVARNLAGFLALTGREGAAAESGAGMTAAGPDGAPAATPGEAEPAGPPPSPGQVAPALALAVALTELAAASVRPAAIPAGP